VNGTPLRVVTSFDSGPGSIRNVIAEIPAGATLDIDPALDGATIQLNEQDHLLIDKDLTIDVTSFSKGLTIDARNFSRIFRVEAGHTLTLRGLTMINGNSGGESGGAVLCLGSGGSPAVLTLDRCLIRGCTAVEGAGVSGLASDFNFVNTTIADNTAQNGAAFSGTTCDLTLTHCTVIGNHANDTNPGKKIGGLLIKNGGSLMLRNSIVANNTATDGTTPDVLLVTALEGVNFFGVPGTATIPGNAGVDYLTGDPGLGPVSCYGGGSRCAHPLLGSPVTNAGGTLGSPPAVDQRGFGRDAMPDIGAVEVGPTIIVDELADENGGTGAGDTSLREAVRDAVPGGLICFAPSLVGSPLVLNSQITLNKDLVISAADHDPGDIVVQGAGSARVFEIPSGHAAVAMDAFVITGGRSSGGNGGGILALGEMLTLTRMSLHDNEAVLGGGVHVEGALLVAENCTVSGNNATNVGGGIYVRNGLAELNHVTVTENSAVTLGGGVRVFNGGKVIYENCIFAANMGPEPDFAIVVGDTFSRAGANLIGSPAGNSFPQGTPNVFGDYCGSLAVPLDPKLGPIIPAGLSFPIAFGPMDDSFALNRATGSSRSADQLGVPRDGRPDIGSVEIDFRVNTPADDNDGMRVNGTSLREALAEHPTTFPIRFDASVFNGEPEDTIRLTRGQLSVTRILEIDGSNIAGGVTIDAAGRTQRVFSVTNGVGAPGAVLRCLTIKGGRTGRGADNVNGAPGGSGAGIHNTGTLTLERCTVTGNLTGRGGNAPGVNVDGHGGHGGGIYSTGSLTVISSTISGNATGAGGKANLEHLGGTGKRGGDGAGIYSSGALTLRAVTISDNSTGAGGTPGGAPGRGGGVFLNAASPSPLNLHSSIVAGNMGDGATANLSATGTVQTGVNFTSGDPELASLADYGGWTPTMPPRLGSPVIDAGGGTDPGGADQRGFNRFVGSQLDIGAVEYQGPNDPVNSGIADFFGDDDADRSANGLEAAIGTNSTDPDPGSPKNLRVTVSGAVPQISFGYDPAVAPFVILRVTRSTDLIDFDHVVISNATTAFGAPNGAGLLMVVDDDPPPGGIALYRLEAIPRF